MSDKIDQLQEPVAIVGMACLYPGAVNLAQYWENILTKKDLFKEVPKTHWLLEEFYHPDPRALRKTYAKKSATLPDIPFDFAKFGVPPNVLPHTDAAQLLGLVVAEALLQDAFGGNFSHLNRERVSVILGFSLGTILSCEAQLPSSQSIWFRVMRECGISEEQIAKIYQRQKAFFLEHNENTFPGLLQNVIAGRIANRLDLHGTNCVVDAACASSLGALHLSIKELLSGDSELVITGGLQTISNPLPYICFSKTPALSFSGTCRPFDDQADGTLLGEGVGFFALKRLCDAEREGNQIYAVIRGIGTSSDGKGKSIYAPEAAGQVRALERAYQRAGYGPETVELVEAHGTGTVAGDAAELKSLTAVLDGTGRRDRQWCALGSIKSQIGHTLGSAGAASLMKTVLALHHKILPPTCHVTHPTKILDFAESPLYVARDPRPWIHTEEYPRRAGVSSFGFGGTNFHVALEEYCGGGKKPLRCDRFPEEIILVSGKSNGELLQNYQGLCESFRKGDSLFALSKNSIAAFSAADPLRLAMVVSSGGELENKLPQIQNALEKNLEEMWLPPVGLYFQSSFRVQKIAFLFPGQGSQYLNMGADLAMRLEPFRRAWDRGDRVSLDGSERLSRIVFPLPGFSEEEIKAQQLRLTATEWAQPALGMTSAAMLTLLEAMALQPDFLAGHSFGEITALYAAGCFSLEQFLQIARKRGELMAQASQQSGGMLAVAGESSQIQKILSEMGGEVLVANDNAPDQCVLSGNSEDLPKIKQRLETEGYKVTALQVSTAFHSPLVWSSTEPFEGYLGHCEIQKPGIPVYSNTHVDPYPSHPAAIRMQIAQHLAKPVRFREQIEALYQAGANLFIEVGPGATLTGLVKKCLGERKHLAIHLDQKNKNGISSLLHAVGQMSAAGLGLNLDFLLKRNLPLRAGFEKTPTTVMISSVTYGKRYPFADEDPKLNTLGQTPVIELGTGNGLNKVLNLALDKDPNLLKDKNDTGIRAKAVGSELMPEPLQKSDASSRKIQPYALNAMPGAPLLKRPTEELDLKMPSPAPRPPARGEATKTPLPIPRPDNPTEEIEREESKLDEAILEKLQSLFLEVISEKTGYPPEIITPTMDLEGDLGIDSIKRVEIFMTMKEKVPELPEVPLQDLASLQTIEQIVSYMMSRGDLEGRETPAPVQKPDTPLPPQPTSVPKASQAPEEEIPEYLQDTRGEGPGTLRIGRQIVKAVPHTHTSPVTLATGHKVWVIDAESGVGQIIAKVLTERGYPARCVAETEPWPDQEKYGAVVYLGGLRELNHLYAGIKLNKEAFRLAKTAAPYLKSAIAAGGGWWISVQDTGGNFGLSGLSGSAAPRGGLAGLTKTLSREWKGLYAKAIDLPRAGKTPEALGKEIVEEILRGGNAVEVGLPRGTERITLGTEPIPTPAEKSAWLDENSVLVVSGGARGITAAGVVAIARKFKPKIVLFGRSPVLSQEPEEVGNIEDEKEMKRALWEAAQKRNESPSPHFIDDQVRRIRQSREVKRTIHLLNEAGSPVKYYAVDLLESRLVRTEGPAWTWKAGSLVRAALAEVRQEWGPIQGLIHGAGVLQDKLIEDKTRQQFDVVFDTKVSGLTELLSALEHEPLRMILLYSSLAARYGNRGQSDYAMANEVLNKIARAEQNKRGGGCLVKAINWGPWEGGMVNDTLQVLLKKFGIPMIPLKEGTRTLVDEIQDPSTDNVEVILRAQWEKSPEEESAESFPETGAQGSDFLGRVQEFLNPEGLKCLEAVRIFDPDKDVWLRDHCPTFVIPTMPLSGMMSLMREAALQLHPESKVVGLDNIQAGHWLEFFNGPQEVRLRAETEHSPDHGLAVRVVLKQYRRAPKKELSRWEPFCSGRVRLAEEYPASPEGPRFNREKCLQEFSGKELYEGGYRFHGPAFQRLVKMTLHPQNCGTTLIDAHEEPQIPTPLDWTLFMDAVAQSLPHEESQSWMQLTGGRLGFPLGVERAQFFRDWPEANRLRCEWEFLGIEQEGRLPKFEIRVYDGTGEKAPLWAKLSWREVLVDLGALTHLSPAFRVAFLRDRRYLPQWTLSRTAPDLSTQITLKDLKAYDWLPGTMAKVYLNEAELEEYRRLKPEECHRWLAPRIAMKEWVARWEMIHPTSVKIEETAPDRYRAVSKKRPINQTKFCSSFNGTAFQIYSEEPFQPHHDLVRQFYLKSSGARHPIDDLVTALAKVFIKEVVLEDPDNFNGLRGRPILFLANHQTFLESFLFSVFMNAVGDIPMVALAKSEHKTLWLGKLGEILTTHPQHPFDFLISYIDREDPEEVWREFSNLEAKLRQKECSLLIHVEGKRSRRANQPVKTISNVLIDLSIKAKIPIVPVRFRGQLPLDDVQTKCDFPFGYTKGSTYFGKAITPDQLESLPYAQRAARVREAVNRLGGENNEFPGPSNPDFGRRVEQWRQKTGVDEAPAVILECLMSLNHLPAERVREGTVRVAQPWVRFLVCAQWFQKTGGSAALLLPDNPEGRWIKNLAQWCFGEKGPKVFTGEALLKDFAVLFRGDEDEK